LSVNRDFSTLIAHKTGGGAGGERKALGDWVLLVKDKAALFRSFNALQSRPTKIASFAESVSTLACSAIEIQLLSMEGVMRESP
jgi:hypothetical protein